MSGMDLSLCPPADAITREEPERAECPLCGDRLAGYLSVCRSCDNGGD